MTGLFDENNQSFETKPEETSLVNGKRYPIRESRPFNWLWLLSIPAALVVLVAGFFGYLAIAKIDPAWAVGASKWLAPPGASIGGHDIGRKNGDDINVALNAVVKDFPACDYFLLKINRTFPFRTARARYRLSATRSRFQWRRAISGFRSTNPRCEKISKRSIRIPGDSGWSETGFASGTNRRIFRSGCPLTLPRRRKAWKR